MQSLLNASATLRSGPGIARSTCNGPTRMGPTPLTGSIFIVSHSHFLLVHPLCSDSAPSRVHCRRTTVGPARRFRLLRPPRWGLQPHSALNKPWPQGSARSRTMVLPRCWLNQISPVPICQAQSSPNVGYGRTWGIEPGGVLFGNVFKAAAVCCFDAGSGSTSSYRTTFAAVSKTK